MGQKFDVTGYVYRGKLIIGMILGVIVGILIAGFLAALIAGATPNYSGNFEVGKKGDRSGSQN